MAPSRITRKNSANNWSKSKTNCASEKDIFAIASVIGVMIAALNPCNARTMIMTVGAVGKRDNEGNRNKK